MINMLIKKLINIPIIQVIFMYILKISATKSIKISVTTIVKYGKLPNDKNKETQCKTAQDFSKFLWNTWKILKNLGQ